MHKSNHSKFSVAWRQSKTKNKAISTAIKSNQTVIGPFLAFNSTSFDSKKPEVSVSKINMSTNDYASDDEDSYHQWKVPVHCYRLLRQR